MSFKDIKKLRQAGKLDKALKMAEHSLEKKPDNIWNKRAAAWVYYDLLKKNNTLDTYKTFKNNLIKLQELQLPENEKMIFDNVAWQLAKMVFDLNKQEHNNYKKINKIFSVIKDFHFSKPSDAYTLLYKSFHKGYQNWPEYLEFAMWWDFKNFLPEDYLKEEFNGKKTNSIAEQAYIAYSKMLLAGIETDIFGTQKGIDVKKIKAFLPHLKEYIKEHPKYRFLPFYRVKLMVASKSKKINIEGFLPFARQKKNEFWIWDLLADVYSNDKDIQFACYCKALILRTSEDYLVNIRQKFAELLISKEMYDEAKTEINKVIETRTKNKWSFPYMINRWIEQDWFETAKYRVDNNDIYSKNIEKAEEILFHDVPEDIVAVEFVNTNKHILSFVKNTDFVGSFKYKEFIKNPKIGDLLQVRFDGKSKNDFYKVSTIRKAKEGTISKAIKEFKGKVKINFPHSSGFVNDIFIDPKIMNSYNLIEGKVIKGKAILSFNKKKDTWGWKQFEIDD